MRQATFQPQQHRERNLQIITKLGLTSLHTMQITVTSFQRKTIGFVCLRAVHDLTSPSSLLAFSKNSFAEHATCSDLADSLQTCGVGDSGNIFKTTMHHFTFIRCDLISTLSNFINNCMIQFSYNAAKKPDYIREFHLMQPSYLTTCWKWLCLEHIRLTILQIKYLPGRG